MKSLRQILIIFAIGLLNGANGQGSEREAVEFGKQFELIISCNIHSHQMSLCFLIMKL